MATTGIVVSIICLFIVCIPAATAQDQGNSGDLISNTESYLIYKLTAPPVYQMNPQQLEQAGDQEHLNPFPDYFRQDVYYTAASQKLEREYSDNNKAKDSHYFSQQELLLRKRSAVVTEQIEKDPKMAPAKIEFLKQEKRNIEDQQARAQQKYNEAYEAEHSGQQSATSGHLCLIVTATYGSPFTSEVQLVRDYRDGTVKQSYTGSQFFLGFNAWYYTFSPAVATYIATHPLVKSVMQVCLIPLLEIILLSQTLHAILGFSPEVATVSVLLFGAALYSLVYIFPLAFLTIWLAKRKGWKIPAPGSMKPVLVLWIFLLSGLATGIIFSFDLLATATSGLLVACTIILVAGTCSLSVSKIRLKKSLENK